MSERDRRQSPRIKFPKYKSGFVVTILLERFFFKEREILCKLRDISEGGASLLVNDDYKKYVNERSVGKVVQLVSENADLAFKLLRKGRVLRVIKEGESITLVVIFTRHAG
jgi:hypothetical protein